MPRCTVCSHRAVTTINRALASASLPVATLASKYGLSRPALTRHRDAHLPPDLLQPAAGEEGKVEAVLAELRSLKGVVLAIMEMSQEKGDLRGAVAAIKECRALLELLSKITGAFVPPPAVQVNLANSLEFQTVSARVIYALDGHPEAKAAVITALGALN